MRLVYTPEGQAEPQRWEFNLGKLRSLEVEQIERLTGWNYGLEYKDRLLNGNMLARRALLYTLQRRAHPTLKFADVDFADDELLLEMDLEELRGARAGAETSVAIPEDRRPLVIAALDQQIAEQEARDDGGKALTPTSDGGTG